MARTARTQSLDEAKKRENARKAYADKIQPTENKAPQKPAVQNAIKRSPFFGTSQGTEAEKPVSNTPRTFIKNPYTGLGASPSGEADKVYKNTGVIYLNGKPFKEAVAENVKEWRIWQESKKKAYGFISPATLDSFLKGSAQTDARKDLTPEQKKSEKQKLYNTALLEGYHAMAKDSADRYAALSYRLKQSDSADYESYNQLYNDVIKAREDWYNAQITLTRFESELNDEEMKRINKDILAQNEYISPLLGGGKKEKTKESEYKGVETGQKYFDRFTGTPLFDSDLGQANKAIMQANYYERALKPLADLYDEMNKDPQKAQEVINKYQTDGEYRAYIDRLEKLRDEYESNFPAIQGNYEKAGDKLSKLYPKQEETESEKTQDIKEYVPGPYAMTKREYLRRRQANPDLPEFGSYEYFQMREEQLRPEMDEIGKDADRKDDTALEWAEAYGNGDEWAVKNPYCKELYEKFQRQNAIVAEYEAINEQLLKFNAKGVHYDENGEVDSKSGADEARYYKERLERIRKANPLTSDEMALGYYDGLDDEAQAKYDKDTDILDQTIVEQEKENAYNYYEKNKDKIYGDNLFGRLSGNYKIGRIGIKENNAGYTSYQASSDDLESVEVYRLLSERIQKSNEPTFKNNNSFQNTVAIVGQYGPQALDQGIRKYAGQAIGALVGLASGTGPEAGRIVGGATAEAIYMYKQTAGGAYARHILDNGLSAEDAKVLARNEAIPATLVEFGLDWAAEKLIKGGSGIKKVITGKAPQKMEDVLIKGFVKKGMSYAGAKGIVQAGKLVGKATLQALSERAEEFIQAGMEKTADRYAREGKTANSWYELAIDSFDYSKYSKQDLKEMKEAADAGGLLGFLGGGVKGAGIKGLSYMSEGRKVLKPKNVFGYLNAIEDVRNSDYSLSDAKAQYLSEQVTKYADKAKNSKTKFGEILNAGKAVSSMAELDGSVKVVIKEGTLTDRQGKFLQALSQKAGVSIVVGNVAGEITDNTDFAKTGFMSVDDNTIALDYRLPMATREDVRKLFYGIATHELSHSGESSKLFGRLKAYVREQMGAEAYDKAVSEMKSERAKAGEELSNIKAENEVVAEYVRTKLFSTVEDMEAFVQREYTTAMSIQDRAKDILNAVKGAFGQETEKIEDGLRLFDRVLATRGTAEAGGTANAIVTLPDGKKYVQADRQVFFSNNPQTWGNEIEKYINEEIRYGRDVIIPTVDGDQIKITEDTAWKIGDMTDWNEETFPTKMNMGTHIDELVQVSKFNNNKDAGDRSEKRFKPDSFDHRTAFFRDFNGDYYRIHISVGVDKSGKTAYSIGKDIQKRSFPGANGSSAQSGRRSKSGAPYAYSTTSSEGSQDLSEKTEMQLALEKAGIDKNTFSNGANSINSLTPEQRQAMQEAEKAAEAAEKGKSIKRLQEQNEYLRRELSKTEAGKLERKAIRQAARDFAKEWSSSVNTESVRLRLQELFYALSEGADKDGIPITSQMVQSEMRKIASDILNEASYTDPDLKERYDGLISYLKGKRVLISEEDAANIPDYNDWRQKYLFRLNVKKTKFMNSENGIAVDSLYKEMSEMWPELFDEQEIPHPADQLIRIGEVIDELHDYTKKPFEDKSEAVEILKNEMLTRFAQIKQDAPRSVESKMQKRIDKITDENRRRVQSLMEKAKADKDSAIENILKEQEQKENELRERRGKSAQIDRIRKLHRKLASRIINPTDKKHLPTGLDKPIAEFLSEIDVTSTRTKEAGYEKATALIRKLEEATAYKDTAALDPDLKANIEELQEALETKKIDEYTSGELFTLRKVLGAIDSYVRNYDRTFAGEKQKRIQDIGSQIMEESREHKRQKNRSKTGEAIYDFINFDQLDSFRFFKRMGGTMNGLFKNLRSGMDNYIQKVDEIRAYMKYAIGEADIKDWYGKKAKVHEIELSGGETIQITTAQIMSLYELLKREQAKKHIFGNGIKIENAGIKGKGYNPNQEAVIITFEDAAEITGHLTEEQIKVADRLAEFFKTTAKWGNEVSNILYGYEKFGAKHYFPIKSDDNFLMTDFESGEAKIKNMGATKSTNSRANNPIIISDIFDVWIQSCEKMAQYNAFVLPLEDLQRAWNYKPRNGKGSVKQSIETAHGKGALTYFDNLMKDINGGTKGARGGEFVNSLLGKMKGAAVGFNISVVVQQPTAIIRATAEIDPKYFIKSIGKSVKWDTVKKYAPIAQWKDWGFFTFDVGKSIEDIVMDKKTVNDVAMWGAGKGDEIGWKTIWKAVEAETRDKRPELSGEDFYKAVGERFSEVIDLTQVVDSVFHRSDLMRSKDTGVKMATAFMSEPTKTYNMLYDKIADLKEFGATKEVKGQLARTISAVLITMVANNAVKALVQAGRDDDKEKGYWGKWGQEFIDNMIEEPFGIVPYVKDIYSIFKGYEIKRTDMQPVEALVKAVRSIKSDKYTEPYKIINVLSAAGALFGVGTANIKRDLQAAAMAIGEYTGSPSVELAITSSIYNPSTAKDMFYPILYKAMAKGKKEEFKTIKELLLQKGFKESDINSKIKTMFSEKKENAGVIEKESQKMLGEAETSPFWEVLPDSAKKEIKEKIRDYAVDVLTQSAYELPFKSTNDAVKNKAKDGHIADVFVNQEMEKTLKDMLINDSPEFEKTKALMLQCGYKESDINNILKDGISDNSTVKSRISTDTDKLISEVKARDEYKGLSDETKAKADKWAAQYAKAEIYAGYDVEASEKWIQNVFDGKELGISATDYILYKAAAEMHKGDRASANDDDRYEALKDMNLSDEQKAYMYLSSKSDKEREAIKEKVDGGADLGLTDWEYIMWQELLREADEEGDQNGSPTREEVINVIGRASFLNDAEKEYLIRLKWKNGLYSSGGGSSKGSSSKSSSGGGSKTPSKSASVPKAPSVPSAPKAPSMPKLR